MAEVRARRVPGMVLIGAASSDAGKTTFATGLIREMSQRQAVIGVKVTVIREGKGPCPHEGNDRKSRRHDGGTCTVCASLGDLPYLLEEERDPSSPKDTGKLLAAGAARVFWLRVAAGHLAAGRDALLEQLPPGEPVVCESNSFRFAVEPDLFLVMQRRDPEAGASKPSCLAVLPMADRVVLSDAQGADMAPADITYVDQRWTFKRSVTAVVLAGGRSRRMGLDKAMIELRGERLITRIVRQLEAHFDEVLISAREPSDYAFVGPRVVADKGVNRGPLDGIAASLKAARHELCLFVPCDVPELPLDLIGRLLRGAAGVDAVVPINERQQYEPLLAVYRRRLRRLVEDMLARGERKVYAIYDHCETKQVPIGAETRLTNLNTRDELAAWIATQDGEN